MQDDIHEAGQAGAANRWKPLDGFRVQNAISNDSKATVPLRHEHCHAACPERSRGVRQERQAPRMRQAARVDHDANPLALRRVVDNRLIRQRNLGDSRRGNRRVAAERDLLLGGAGGREQSHDRRGA